jgi:hypothetical protein
LVIKVGLRQTLGAGEALVALTDNQKVNLSFLIMEQKRPLARRLAVAFL